MPDPLPREPEPTPLPDEPPTGPWDDVPPPPPDAPGLEPVGDRTPIDDEIDTGGHPTLVWNGDGWGVAWSGLDAGRFQVLDADGRPLGRAALVPARRERVSLDFAIGRYAVVSSAGTGGTYDRAGTFVSGWSTFEPVYFLDVARLPIAHRWLVASSEADGHRDAEIRAFLLDDAMSPAGARRVLGVGLGGVRVAVAKTRALVVWETRTGIHGAIVRGAELEPLGPQLDILGFSDEGGGGFEVETFRDRFVVAAATPGETRARIVDPFASSLTTPPINVVRGRVRDRPGIAVAPEHGFFVVCSATGSMPGHSPTGISLHVIGCLVKPGVSMTRAVRHYVRTLRARDRG